MSKFKKAVTEQAFLKLGLYGKTGSGKTLTSLLIAEGLAKHSGGRVAYIDTEHGTDFYAVTIPERRVHPDAFDFDRIKTRSLTDALEAVEEIDPAVHSVVVIDSITHLWEAARAAYMGKTTVTGGIPIQAWGPIKKPYKRLMSLFLDGPFHAIICGREGVVMEEDEDGDVKVTGARMKAEGETPHEPHLLARMRADQDKTGAYVIRTFFEKDRSGILTSRTFDWPNFETIRPLLSYLSGGSQGQMGTPEQNAEHDAEALSQAEEKKTAERRELFTQIRDAVQAAQNIEALRVAWSLTSGKKTKLGEDFMSQLEATKEGRKLELLREVA